MDAHIELSTLHRALRGAVGAGALMAIFFIPELTAGALFTLALVNCYASLTAILGFDFVGAMITVIGGRSVEQPEPPRPAIELAQIIELPRRVNEEVEYRKAA